MSRSIVMLCAAAALVVACLANASPLGDLAAFGYNPGANAEAVVQMGPARFTVLTPYIIRMEYDASQNFENRATIAVVNRYFAQAPAFTHSVSNGLLTIQTDKVKLQYVVDNPFTAQTLSINVLSNGATWHYGDVDYQNLFGAIRSLDVECTISLNCTDVANVQIHNESLHCAWGVISRGGWTTITDTGNYIMGNNSGDWFSTTMRNTDEIDVYFFGHGNNYRQALQDFTDISGKIPMLPRPMLGSWYTRWFDFDNSDIERLVDIYDKENVPLTTLIFDMNWHTKNDWTGYSWDKQLFPNPNDNLAWLRNKGLIIAGNMHDADGVGWWEDKYHEMCMIMGQNPATLSPVMFQPLNETYMHALEDVVVKYANFDFTWIDWQQGGWAGGCTGGRLNPTLITDHVRSTDNLRTGVNQRDGVLARFGGLGSQRYPVGFSGDVLSLTWECMAFQPYFSITGSNVGYGYWSNDLVGPETDHELHVRWMQFGAFSGIMRIHDRGMSTGPCYASGSCPIVNIWKIPYHYFDAIRKAMTARVALLPYLYTESYNAYLTGVTPTYPMYYDYPDMNDAYAMGPDGVHAQYMFGSQMLVAPICAAANSGTALATKEIWLPPGVWYDEVFGTLHHSIGSYLTSNYALEDVPLFVKAGAIVPRIPNPEKIGVGTSRYDALDIYIYPGNTSGTYQLYEDDGMSYDYLKKPQGSSQVTTISYTATETGITITVSAASVTAPWLPTMRKWRFFLVQAAPLSSASISSSSLPYARFGGDNSWTWDGKTVATIIDVGSRATAQAISVQATYVSGVTTTDLGYLRGFASRTRLAKRMLDDLRITPDEMTVGPGLLKQAGARAVYLTYLAGANTTEFVTEMSSYVGLMNSALAEIGGNPNPASEHKHLTQLWDSSRNDMLLCGSKNCLDVNYQYTVMWSEGYQPSSVSTDSIPLYDYYDKQVKDNYATTLSTAPTGYVAAVFNNGKVYQTDKTGRACLSVYSSPTTNDHLTTAVQQGIDFAQGNNYVKTHNCIAYVDTQPTLKGHEHPKNVNGMKAGEFSKLLTKIEEETAARTRMAKKENEEKNSSFKLRSQSAQQHIKKLSTKDVAAKSESERKNYMQKDVLGSSSAMTMAQALLQSCLPPQ